MARGLVYPFGWGYYRSFAAGPGFYKSRILQLEQRQALAGEGAQRVKSVHWEHCCSDLGREIIPSSFCKRPRIINALISYQADKLGCGVNKFSAGRGGLAKPLGFAESSRQMLMPGPGKALWGREAGPPPLWGGLCRNPRSRVSGSHGTWYSCPWC